MKITVYTITDCYFSNQEKDYLKSHNIPFEEKNLEENRDWLTEMLTISNNFAGTPVTKIEKDDGTIIVLKGFTQAEFDEKLGIKDLPINQPVINQTAQKVQKPTVPPAQEVKPIAEEPKLQTQAPVVTQPTFDEPVVATPSVAPVEATKQVTDAPATVPDPATIAAQIEELKRLQESLMSKAQAVAPVASVAGSAPQVAPAPQVPTAQPVAVGQPQAPSPAVAQDQVPAPTQNAVDDSLAAILAELQAKINSANTQGTQGSTS